MVSQLIPQGFCPSGVIKQPYLVVTEITCHGTGITDIRKGASDDNTIKVGKHAADLVLVRFDERIHIAYPLFLATADRDGVYNYFGSGYAGLGK
jgi:hypothetical protein